jgi:hypothetical protein
MVNNIYKNTVTPPVTSPSYMETVLQSIHFRKIFYLVCVLALVLLLGIKYTILPVIDRREAEPKKIIRHVLDTLIAVLIAGMAIGAVVFWISGNE